MIFNPYKVIKEYAFIQMTTISITPNLDDEETVDKWI